MQITHYGHSCVGIEKDGTAILLDPGKFAFEEKQSSPESLTGFSAILLTHEHIDHTDPEILKVLVQINPACTIYTNASIQKLLLEVGLQSMVLLPMETVKVGSLTVNGVEAPHGSLPVPVPESIAFLVDDVVFHPGDSIHPHPTLTGVKVLLAPACAPWMNANQAIEFVERIKPDIVMPIHTALYRYPMLIERLFCTPLRERGFYIERERITL